ncbi:efflux RND transporter periplasmic adaptor subunit [Sphingomonas sp. 3P27F8]|uniref:efflux RND transporter periplasmic adaptor subunit n=1 Tax=Sphingomonas sp. 3P27F8 TaxID=2502213 RepID=UPI0010F462C6|nr:efflux RND transporter periplasmic adaptor subunit [Sphingomonas sp. 3P27F8]
MKFSVPAFLSICLALAGCGRDQSQTAPVVKPDQVEVVSVQSSNLSTTVSLPAQLQPYETVDIFPRVAGFIRDITVDRGSVVRRGQPLVRLTAPELGAQREQAQGVLRAALAKAAADNATYARLANAAKTPGVVAENDVNIARQTAAADNAQVASARESLRNVGQQEAYLTITAPFDGVITARNLHPGALVGPSSSSPGAQPILQMANVRRLRLVIAVPVVDVQDVRVGQIVSFTVPSVPGRKFEAPVARIADALDNRTRTMAIELDVQNSEAVLTAGEFATVQWPVRRPMPTMQVPQTAIANDQQTQFVIKVANGTAHWITVTTGMTVDGKTEIFGTINPGDFVVKRASDALHDGATVRAKKAPPEPSAKAA